MLELHNDTFLFDLIVHQWHYPICANGSKVLKISVNLLNVVYSILSYLPKIASVLVERIEMPINKYSVFLTNTGPGETMFVETPCTVVYNLGSLKRE